MEDNKKLLWSSEIDGEVLDNSDLSQEVLEVLEKANAEELKMLKGKLMRIKVPILIIGELMFWNGKRIGYAVKDNIADCFGQSRYEISFYLDNKELTATEVHHDGVNHYWYRGFCDAVTESEKEELYAAICGEVDEARRLIEKYTYSIGEIIAKCLQL